MSSEVAIRVENLSKCYQIYERPRDRLMQMFTRGRKRYFQEFWALRDVSFDVRRGETVGVIGRNGSGKSTLLQLICGTLNPSAGSIEVNGRIAALLELGSGFNPEYTGRENVFMNGALLGLQRAQIESRLDAIAAFADIGRFLDQPLKTYSTGMIMRLAFAVIAHVDAQILVIDEALAVGDAVFVQKCMRFLRTFMEHGTVLFVSHDIGAVRGLCNRAVWLSAGRVQADAAPRQVADRYLQYMYEQAAGESLVLDGVPHPKDPRAAPDRSDEWVDMRARFANQAGLRNDIEIFQFREDARSFGLGGASIVDVVVRDDAGQPLSCVVGGELVSIEIRVTASVDLEKPIIGFTVKDRLGQPLFGDNTYLYFCDRPLAVRAGQALGARFSFRMPTLRKGEYTIDVAIAEGTQEQHVQHCWMHDVLSLSSVSSSVANGLVGIAVLDVELSTNDGKRRASESVN